MFNSLFLLTHYYNHGYVTISSKRAVRFRKLYSISHELVNREDAVRAQVDEDDFETEEAVFDSIDMLEVSKFIELIWILSHIDHKEYDVNVGDINKLKEAGFQTIKSVVMNTSKVGFDISHTSITVLFTLLVSVWWQ